MLGSIELRPFINVFVVQPKSFFEWLRDGSQWYNRLWNGVDYEPEQLKKIILLFSPMDFVREAQGAMDLVCKTYANWTEKDYSSRVRMIADLGAAICGGVEALMRVFKMLHVWGIREVKNLTQYEVVGAIADIFATVYGAGKSIRFLWKTPKEAKNDFEEKRALQKRELNWGLVALNVSVAVIEVLSLIALAYVVSSLAFLVVSTAIVLSSTYVCFKSQQMSALNDHELITLQSRAV